MLVLGSLFNDRRIYALHCDNCDVMYAVETRISAGNADSVNVYCEQGHLVGSVREDIGGEIRLSRRNRVEE